MCVHNKETIIHELSVTIPVHLNGVLFVSFCLINKSDCFLQNCNVYVQREEALMRKAHFHSCDPSLASFLDVVLSENVKVSAQVCQLHANLGVLSFHQEVVQDLIVNLKAKDGFQ